MAKEYIYFMSATSLFVLALIGWFIVRRNHKHDTLDMPKNEGDPLFDNENKPATANTGRWGDQIVGTPRVISAESVEDRISRIHQRAQEYQAQHARPKLYSNSPQAYTPSLSSHVPTRHTITQQRNTAFKAQTPALCVLYVMAPTGKSYSGYELYHALINTGLIYGKMNIFHYHLHENNSQPVLFSVASAVNPGVIDVDNIANFSTPGLTLFMNTSHRAHQHAAYEAMVAVAEQLAEELGGVILDENRQPWTAPETVQQH